MTRILIILPALILFFGPAAAQTAGQEFRAKLEASGNVNKTIRCAFTQIRKVKNIRETVSSEGMFYYDNSGMMALRYTSPPGDMVIMDGDRFTIVASGKKTDADASSNPMMAQISYMMQACMSGDVSKLGRGWDMTVESSPGGYIVTIKPTDRRVKKYISSMTMCFAVADLTLDRLRIDEASGGYTEYEFHDKELNRPIDRSYFTID